MKWMQITVATTTEGSDLVASVMCDFGSDGVSIVDHNDVVELIHNNQNWDYIDESLLNQSNADKALVNGFFDENFDTSGIISALEKLKTESVFSMGSMEISTALIASEDWENEWRKYYAPIKIGKTVIIPAWQKYDISDSEIPVYIEPGMAFGTGNHETTSMCVSLMQSLALSGKKVADIGCGSGILGSCALSLGADKCVFNDIDPLAIKATEENLALNHFDNAELICGDLNAGDNVFDVVLANLTADLLLRLLEKLQKLLSEGGIIIISGIINRRAEEVFSAFEQVLHPLKVMKNGEWQAMMFKKK